MKRVHAVVTGRVQGVGYRYTLRAVAQDAGVSGWVRNRVDGSVEAELEGGDDDVDQVLEWMARGPSAARPSGVRTDLMPLSGAVGFELRPTS